MCIIRCPPSVLSQFLLWLPSVFFCQALVCVSVNGVEEVALFGLFKCQFFSLELW
jgi:hypothetical protein